MTRARAVLSPEAMAERRYDLILAGGGLASSLIAWRLKLRRPALSVAVVEREPRLGGEHTWSFFDSDLTPEQRSWIAPAVVRRWPGYDVAFPQRRRTLNTAYNSVSSERLHAAVAPMLGERLLTGEIVEVGPTSVRLADGRALAAGGVIDARGPGPTPHLQLGWQKFVGMEVRTAEPHGLERPVVMDATVDQLDGYRFVYLLPFSADRLLIEDTYYSDGPALDAAALEGRIEAYAAARGWRIAETVRRETGVLPIALAGDIEAFWDEGPPVARAGLKAALFHPTTGYSLPDAVATAWEIAELPDLSGAALHAFTRRRSVETWKRRGFFRLIDRMLFRACAPDRRWTVLQRFYGLPEPLIRRFYAARMTAGDKLRVLAGRPPVPLGAALRQVRET